MRWRIYGSDARSGDAVLLDVDAGTAAEAVTCAHDRDIVVSGVARAGGARLWKALPFLAVVLAITLGLAAGVLHHQLGEARRTLKESEREGQRMLADLQGTRSKLGAAQARLIFLEGPHSASGGANDAEIVELRKQLAVAMASMRSLDATGRDAAAKLGQLAMQLEEARRQASESEALRKDAQGLLESALAGAKSEQKKAADALAAAGARSKQDAARVAMLEGRVGDLAARLKTAEGGAASLRSELEETRGAAAATRHSLAISYDDALAFAALEFGKPDFRAGRDSITVTATQAERANTFAMQTDKERVFDVTVQVCLASDAPKDVLAANHALVEKYVAQFAPRWKEASTWLAKSIKQVGPGSGKEENERLVLFTDHYRLSLWCNRDAQYSLRIEPANPE